MKPDSTIDSRSTPRPRLWWVGTVAGIVLAVVLLVAVWAKAVDPASFAEQIRTEKLDFLLSAPTVALIALALETGLGLALLLGVRRKWVLVPATLLVAFFLFLTGRSWWLSAHGLRDAAASCGCFGNLVQRTPSEAFWQDLLLMVPALLLAFAGRGKPGERGPLFPPVRTAVVLLGTVAVALFAWKAPELPLDNVATRLRPGVRVSDLCAGSGREAICLNGVARGITEGDNLVLMANLDDPALGASMEALNAAARNPAGPKIWLLSAATPEQVTTFNFMMGPVFKLVETPPELMRPLYRRLPRAFRVKDGTVTETWPGLPPLSTPTS